MPPKKSAAQAKGVLPKAEVPPCCLYIEALPLPTWDDNELEREQWGDLNATSAVDPNALFVDPDFGGQIGAFGKYQVSLKRPSAIFSPFKPVVYRPLIPTNPYEYEPPEEVADEEDEDEDRPPQSRAEMIRRYRVMRTFRLGEVEPPEAGSVDRNRGSPSRARHLMKKRDKNQEPTPLFMRAFNSALMAISHNADRIAPGSYAWELIYPKQPGSVFPAYNPMGKYAIKLFVGGTHRKVMIDDRLPVDVFEQSILTVTDQKEIWPALLAKAMLKVLGPDHQQLLIDNPVWALTALTHGWIPQVLRPVSQEIATIGALRQAVAGKSEPPPNHQHLIACATCEDASVLNGELAGPEEQYASAGIQAKQLFSVLDVRPYQNTSLLRLAAFRANWQGTYRYDGGAWNQEFETELGFYPATDRNKDDLAKRWVDFWITWENFTTYFSSVVIFRDTMDSRYTKYKQIACVADPIVETKPAAKGKGAAKSAPPPEDLAKLEAERMMPKNFTKWIKFDVEADTSALVTFTGLQVPREGFGNMQCDISRYTWDAPSPLLPVGSMSVGYGIAHSIPLRVPKGSTAFKVECNALPVDTMVSIATSEEFQMGDEKEIVKEAMGVTIGSDTGMYGVHTPGHATTWFKRVITVKAETTAHFVLSTLPKGTDLAAHRTMAAEQPTAGKKEKSAAKPAKGKDAVPEVNPDDEVDDSEHDVPIIETAIMRLINLDTMEATDDVVGKIMSATLTPNTKGWLLIAFSRPTERYGKGYWKLLCTSNRSFDSFEMRTFDDLTSRSGAYQHNDYSSLFRYNFTVGDPATASIQLVLQDTWGIPFVLRLLHNDKEIERREGKHVAFIEHVNLAPSDKATPSQYAIHCTLDQRYTASWEEQRREQVVDMYRSDCKVQEAHLVKRAAMLSEMLTSNPDATIPDEGTSRPGSVISDGLSIQFDLNLHCSTSKVEIKEDNSIIETLNAMKASWSKGKDDADPKAKKEKPSKNAAPVDEAAVRQQKAKEAREKFLANRRRIFVPYLQEGKAFVKAEDEPLARMAPLRPVVAANIPNRLHNGVTLNGMLNGAVIGPVVEPPPMPPVPISSPPPTAPVPEKGGKMSKAAMEKAAKEAAEREQAELDSMTPQKTQVLQDLSEIVRRANTRKEYRKTLLGAMNDAITMSWNERNPSRPMSTEPNEDDKGKRKKK